MNRFAIALALSVLALPAFAQNANPDDPMKDCPMHDQHAAHHTIVESRGDQTMGFLHEKTTHHFRIMTDSGAIEIVANDSQDLTNTEAIRLHLSQIVMMFGTGDFSAPTFIHDGAPPGVTTMRLMKSAIRYLYEEMPSGGRVRIKSGPDCGCFDP
jgi:hypothetical protein